MLPAVILPATLLALACAPHLSWALSDAPPMVPAAPIATDPDKAALGERLFHDARLSADGRRACSTCHDLAQGGVNPSIPPSSAGPHRGFDTPSIFNAALNYRFGWLAEHRTLEAFNEEILGSPDIMAADWTAVLATLNADAWYSDRFRAIYGRGWGRSEVLQALAEFQRSLVTPNSRFDRFLEGQADALTAEEAQGYRLFQDLGCMSCHQGRNVGGSLVQKFGVFAGPRDTANRDLRGADIGRFAITGLERDRHVFRVPSLRNVAVTAPYLHDGRVARLDEVVDIMGRMQLGRDLSRHDIDAIVKFLRTLTGEYKGVPLDQLRPGAPR
ncbi:hypothetical protein VQ02_06810 [Methylobacterium variabile]|uniref:Cytochrome c domain-containing protein n=1 Tax=Methylobacterium variabile TaxID=298794 RepID=A0A0J6T513_9HYPH|nr:hypothetical protein VQ02_06810 [Methylobacterium variabile]